MLSLHFGVSRHVQKAFEDTVIVIFRWGTPEVLFTDNGTEFWNKLISKTASELGIGHSTTPPYHQANPVERVNRVLKTMISSFVEGDHRSWDKHLPDFRFAYYTDVHGSTRVSPALLNFGREPRQAKTLRKLEEGVPEIEPLAIEEWEDRIKRLPAFMDL